MSEEYKDFQIYAEGIKYKTLTTKKFDNRKNWEKPDPKKIISFIPGTIVETLVKEGQEVKKGETLLILKAMKMNNSILMPFDGVIKTVNVKVDEVVPKNQLLIEIE